MTSDSIHTKQELYDLQQKFNALMRKHDEAEEMDAGFDAGEFSGPEHSRMREHETEKFQLDNRITDDEMARILFEDLEVMP